MTEFGEGLSAALWADLPNAQGFPATSPLLAHYTSVATLEKMLLEDEVWFSNPLFMSDFEEMRFGMLTGAIEFRKNTALQAACRTSDRHAVLIRYFDDLARAFESKHALDTYVLCLSQHDPSDNDGVLSMWRGYGVNGGGVAIVFDASKLNAVQDSPFIVGKVQYASKADRHAWISGSIGTVAEHLSDVEASDVNLYAAAYYWHE